MANTQLQAVGTDGLLGSLSLGHQALSGPPAHRASSGPSTLSHRGLSLLIAPALALQKGDQVVCCSVFAPFPVDRRQVILFQVRFDVLLCVCLVKKNHRH